MKNYKIYLSIWLVSFLFFLASPANAVVVSSIVAIAAGFALGFATAALGISVSVGVLTGIASAIGSIAAIAVYGGVAAAIAGGGKAQPSGGVQSSPTLSGGVLQTSINPNLPLQLIYGENKLAGNIIWQTESGGNVYKIVAFGFGEIQGFSDVRADDKVVSGAIGSYTAYTGNGAQTIDSRVTGATQSDKAQIIGGLKHIAYLAITLNPTQEITKNANITALVQGRKVRVYADSETYTTEYSANPAWVVLDLLISYGALGECIGTNGLIDDDLIEKYIDIDTFIESADYCDEVPTGLTDKRFEFHSIFDSKYTIFDAIAEVKKVCRGGLFVKNNKLQFKIDKAEDVSKVLTVDDIVPLSETFTSLPLDKTCDVFKVEYISPEHEWAKIQAQAELPTYKNRAAKSFIQDIFGCKSFEQASRLAWYYANRQILAPYSGSFETGFIAQSFEVGQVITIPVEMLALGALNVKITSVTISKNGRFKVDWFNYDANLYADNMGAQEPTLIVNNVNNPYIPPSDVTGFKSTIILGNIQFEWNDSEPNVKYEIREGTSWAKAFVIAKNIIGGYFTKPIAGTGAKNFLIKAISEKGIYSTNAANSALIISNMYQRNVVVEQDLLESGYTLTDCNIYDEAIYPNITNNWQIIDNWLAEDAYYHAPDNSWGGSVEAESSFISKVFDIGGVFDSIVSINFNFADFDDTQNDYAILWKYADTEANFQAEWQAFTPGSYQFRYYQFKIVLTNPNNEMSMFETPVVTVDVPDRNEIYRERAIPAGGLTITFATDSDSKVKEPYTIAPNISFGLKTGSEPYYSDKTRESVKINIDGGGVVDVYVSGY